jgi:uncharacterized surface protein with fasciclin (FAS1) repeats
MSIRRGFILGVALAFTAPMLTFAAGDKTVADVVKADPQLSTLARAIDAAGLAGALSGAEPVTLFAPTDEAFAKLPAGALDNLLKPENRDTLVAVLKHHVVAGKLGRDEVKKRREVTPLSGKALDVALERGNIVVGGGKLTARERPASNGRVHVLDTVLLP